MPGKRRLTVEEKKRIIDERRVREHAKNPRLEIIVHVDDETDDNGEPVVRITKIKETWR
jgi:hypothetical protein